LHPLDIKPQIKYIFILIDEKKDSRAMLIVKKVLTEKVCVINFNNSQFHAPTKTVNFQKTITLLLDKIFKKRYIVFCIQCMYN